MSFGLQLRDETGSVYFDSGANSLRTMSYAEFTVAGNGSTFDLGADFDASRELVLAYQKTPNDSGTPFYYISGTTMVFDSNSGGAPLIIQRVRYR